MKIMSPFHLRFSLIVLVPSLAVCANDRNKQQPFEEEFIYYDYAVGVSHRNISQDSEEDFSYYDYSVSAEDNFAVPGSDRKETIVKAPPGLELHGGATSAPTGVEKRMIATPPSDNESRLPLPASGIGAQISVREDLFNADQYATVNSISKYTNNKSRKRTNMKN